MSKSVFVFDQLHVAPVAGGNGEDFLKLVTDVLTPANGAKLSGSTVLVATATGYFSVTKLELYLTGGSQHDTLIGTGRQSTNGWITGWNTTTVTNGTYTLQSVAYGAGGISGTSASVPSPSQTDDYVCCMVGLCLCRLRTTGIAESAA